MKRLTKTRKELMARLAAATEHAAECAARGESPRGLAGEPIGMRLTCSAIELARREQLPCVARQLDEIEWDWRQDSPGAARHQSVIDAESARLARAGEAWRLFCEWVRDQGCGDLLDRLSVAQQTLTGRERKNTTRRLREKLRARLGIDLWAPRAEDVLAANGAV